MSQKPDKTLRAKVFSRLGLETEPARFPDEFDALLSAKACITPQSEFFIHDNSAVVRLTTVIDAHQSRRSVLDVFQKFEDNVYSKVLTLGAFGDKSASLQKLSWLAQLQNKSVIPTGDLSHANISQIPQEILDEPVDYSVALNPLEVPSAPTPAAGFVE